MGGGQPFFEVAYREKGLGKRHLCAKKLCLQMQAELFQVKFQSGEISEGNGRKAPLLTPEEYISGS